MAVDDPIESVTINADPVPRTVNMSNDPAEPAVINTPMAIDNVTPDVSLYYYIFILKSSPLTNFSQPIISGCGRSHFS